MTFASDHFSVTAEGYAATMVPSLRRVAERVVAGAELRDGDVVLDVGTGTGTAAGLARGGGRTVVGIDAAPGMLALARRGVEGVEFREMDFAALAFDDATFDVVLAVHALLFATDQRAALVEWRRVTRGGGRLSLSVPGPVEATPTAVYREVYERHGIDTSGRYPTPDSLGDLAASAGWERVMVSADPEMAIELPDEEAFRLWRSIGMRGPATAHYTDADHRRLTDEMLAVTPRTPDAGYRIPFGAIYLTALAPGSG